MNSVYKRTDSEILTSNSLSFLQLQYILRNFSTQAYINTKNLRVNSKQKPTIMNYFAAVVLFSSVLALSSGQQYRGGNRNTGRGYYQGGNNGYNVGVPVGQGYANSGYANGGNANGGYNNGGNANGGYNNGGNANGGYSNGGYNNGGYNNNNIGNPGYIAIDPPYFPGSNGYGDFSNINNQRFPTSGYSG